MGVALLHRERGATALKDTQKVWLCAAPADYREYGRALTEELLDCRSTISVWYPMEPGQEIMRLIHKNEYSRDIAIWYDEFLTPGEDFNDSIREAQ